MDPQSCAAVSLWRISTCDSIMECTVERISTWHELRVRQNGEVLVRQQFASHRAALKYAEQLHERLAPVAKAPAEPGS